MYSNELFEIMKSFKDLGLEVPSNYRWNEYATHLLEVGEKAYDAFETYVMVGKLNSEFLRNVISTL